MTLLFLGSFILKLVGMCFSPLIFSLVYSPNGNKPTDHELVAKCCKIDRSLVFLGPEATPVSIPGSSGQLGPRTTPLFLLSVMRVKVGLSCWGGSPVGRVRHIIHREALFLFPKD